MLDKNDRLKEIIRDLAARFVSLESNRTSLITVTSIELKDRGKKAVVRCTVYPGDKETEALEFLKRLRSDFREFVKSESKLMRIPFFDFAIDLGEKNRQRLDELK